MDKEAIQYIITHFRELLTDDEKLALQYQMYMDKTSDNAKLRKIMIEKGWITTENQPLELLKKGYEDFEANVVKRIMNETPEKVFFNNCSKCGKLARTPKAKQCRYCLYNWH